MPRTIPKSAFFSTNTNTYQNKSREVNPFFWLSPDRADKSALFHSKWRENCIVLPGKWHLNTITILILDSLMLYVMKLNCKIYSIAPTESPTNVADVVLPPCVCVPPQDSWFSDFPLRSSICVQLHVTCWAYFSFHRRELLSRQMFFPIEISFPLHTYMFLLYYITSCSAHRKKHGKTFIRKYWGHSFYKN